MKKIHYMVIAAMMVIGAASCAPRGDRTSEMMEKLELGEIPEEVDVFKVNPSLSEVVWEGKKITGSGHHGTLSIKRGELYAYEGKLLGGNLVIDMTSIVVVDIEDPGSNARLKGHLESDDFFSVATYPESSIDIVSFEPIEGATAGDSSYRVTGNLTIKGITHGIAFNATINKSDDTIQATTALDFDRSKYDVRFGSGKFFTDLGDNLILDAINLDIDIKAVKQ